MVSKAVFLDSIKACHIQIRCLLREIMKTYITQPYPCNMEYYNYFIPVIYIQDMLTSTQEVPAHVLSTDLWRWWSSIDKEVQITQGCIPNQSKSLIVKASIWLRKTQACTLNLVWNSIFSKPLSQHLQFPYPLPRHKIIQMHLLCFP